MKIAIFGAGAIGGYLAVKLHQAGADVSVIARGAHLAAIRENGLTVKSDGQTVNARLPATDKAEEAGLQDYVIVTLKASIPCQKPHGDRQADRTQDSPVKCKEWDYPIGIFYGLDSPWRKDHVVESVDPGGRLFHLLPPRQVVGCIAFHAAEVKEPGVVEHTYATVSVSGEPDSSNCAVLEVLSQMLSGCGAQRAGSCQHPRRNIAQTLRQSRLQSHVGADGIDRGSAGLSARPACCRADPDGGSSHSGRSFGGPIDHECR